MGYVISSFKTKYDEMDPKDGAIQNQVVSSLYRH